MTIDDAIRYLGMLIDFIHGESRYEEFENDLYSLLDALNEDKGKNNLD